MRNLYRKKVTRVEDETCLNITSREDGSLAVLMCVIKTAADDVRRYLNPPVPIHPRRSTTVAAVKKIQADGVVSHQRARSAARFLAGGDAGVVCRVLATCGVHVPLAEILRELHAIKRTGGQP